MTAGIPPIFPHNRGQPHSKRNPLANFADTNTGMRDRLTDTDRDTDTDSVDPESDAYRCAGLQATRTCRQRFPANWCQFLRRTLCQIVIVSMPNALQQHDRWQQPCFWPQCRRILWIVQSPCQNDKLQGVAFSTNSAEKRDQNRARINGGELNLHK